MSVTKRIMDELVTVDDEVDERLVAESMWRKELARRLPRQPLVLVTWEDAYSSSRWDSIGAYSADQATFTVTSVGFLVRDDGHAIRLLQSVSDDLGADALTIPRPMVRTVTAVQPA